MAETDYPFPASEHQILFQPAFDNVDSHFTLGDVISGKAILNFDNRHICSCGAVYELPESVVEMAVKLAETMPLDTPMIYGLSHIYDESAEGLTGEEIAERLRNWYDNPDNQQKATGGMVKYFPYQG